MNRNVLHEENVELLEFFIDEIERRCRPRIEAEIAEIENGRNLHWLERNQIANNAVKQVFRDLLSLVIPEPPLRKGM